MDLKKKPYYTSLIVFAFCISLSIVVTYFVNKNITKIAKQELEISAGEIKSKIEIRLKAYAQFSQSSSSFFMASDSVTRADWKNFISKSKIGNYLKGFQGVAYISKLTKGQLPNHINWLKKEYSSNYTVFPETETTEITPITYIEPTNDRNKKAIGFNVSSNPNMRMALVQSRDLNTPILTNKSVLVQDGLAEGKPGLVIYSPIFNNSKIKNNGTSKEGSHIGWTGISIRIDDFMKGIIEPYNVGIKNPINLTIFDGESLENNNILFSTCKFENLINENNVNTLISSIKINNKVWTFQFAQIQKPFISSFAFIVFIIGIVISLLLSTLVFSLSNTANFAKKIAFNLTSDLQEKNEELITAKEIAEESEKQLKLISNNLVNGMIYQVIAIDETRRKFTYLSDAVEHLYGYTAKEVKEDPNLIYGRIHKDDIEYLVAKEKQALAEMSVFKAEVRVVNPDSSIRWSLYISKPRMLKGEVCWDGIEVDITEQKGVENELIIAKSKVEESNRLKTEFLNNLSHEIRTPMNGILGFTDFLGNPDLSVDKRNNYVQIVKSSTFQLLKIIDDIIEISRLETKQVKVYENEVCLNELFLSLFSKFDLKAKENKIPLYVNNELSDEESTIRTDKGKIHKIINNLLENALKFTNEGFIEFGYKLKNKNELEIYVKDTGVGIDSLKHELIFERFSQAEGNLSKKSGGLGLGLSIVRENVALIGGDIRVESNKGEGTIFYIAIPYNNVYKKEIKEKINSTFSENYTILIAEDEEVNYLYLETLIQDSLKLDCKLIHAKNGEEAVQICGVDNTISLVLMDLKMPVLNGFEAVVKMKELKPELLVIAQSAYSAVEEIEKAMNAGFDDFISKPIGVSDFKSLINKYLGDIQGKNKSAT